jgi:CheY-like chemotaxis protein
MAMIVTAEDNEDVRVLTARSLRRAGHTVVETADGLEGLAAVREHAPDVVITDVDMPRMTGLELCRAIRDDPELRHTPVLVVSGSITPDDSSAASSGVTAILGKPFAPSELLQRLDEMLAHPSQRAQHSS